MTRFVPQAAPSRVCRVAASAALGATLLVGSGSATAHNYYRAVPAPPAVPTSADQIQNIDQVKTAIKGYYGDTLTTQVDPVANSIDGKDVLLHQFSATSNYAAEVGASCRRREGAGQAQGRDDAPPRGSVRRRRHHAEHVQLRDLLELRLQPGDQCRLRRQPTFNLPAVPHMVDLEHYAVARGYTVFYLTGRPVTQLAGTIQDLQAAGYQFDPSNVYTKDPAAPWLSSCSNGTTVTCTTTQYKSLTRQHIESLGYDIVANFGDQYSDLNGGFADQTFKIPNPMYFLP